MTLDTPIREPDQIRQSCASKLWAVQVSNHFQAIPELSKQYELGARMWAFDHWAERLCKPTGERAFESWSGGLLGVLKQEIDDMGTWLKTWLM